MRSFIGNAISLISILMENPKELHLFVEKRILHYLKDIEFGLLYKKDEKSELIRFSDIGYAGDLDDRKSTSGYVYVLSLGATS